MKAFFKVLLKRFLGLSWILQVVISLTIVVYVPTFFMWALNLNYYSVENQQKISNEKYLFVGQYVPYEKWSEYGNPQTLKGTNNKYWIAYLPKINTTFKARKSDDEIVRVSIGKVPNLIGF